MMVDMVAGKKYQIKHTSADKHKREHRASHPGSHKRK